MNQEEKDISGIDLSKSFSENREFQGEKSSSEYFFRPGTPKIIQWTVKYSGGIIKNERQASYVLLGFIVLTIIVSIILFLNILKGPAIPPEALERPEYGLPIED